MLTTLRATVESQLDASAQRWLTRALAQPDGLDTSFAAAGRACGSPHATDVRILLLHAHQPPLDHLTHLYQHGTASERNAVLRALPHLRNLETESAALPLLHDALRTNDPRLVAAALGPYGAAHLPPHDWRQAVLKCLFSNIPLAHVHALARRATADGELARMLRDFARERTAAGRPVPADLQYALELTARPHRQEA